MLFFTRPTDLYYHLDVHKAVRVESGEGRLYLGEFDPNGLNFKQYELGKRKYQVQAINIPKGTPHCFAIDDDSYLEVRVNYSGILNPKNEKRIK